MNKDPRTLINQYEEQFTKAHFSRQLSAYDMKSLFEIASEASLLSDPEEAGYDPQKDFYIELILASWKYGFMRGYEAGENDTKRQQKAKKESVPLCGMIRK